MAEAARSAAKADEVEMRLAPNDVRFARDACLRQMMLGLRRMMRAYGALRFTLFVRADRPRGSRTQRGGSAVGAPMANEAVSKSLPLRGEGG